MPPSQDEHALWRAIAACARNRLPMLAQAMDGAEDDVLAYMIFSAAYRTKLHPTNTLSIPIGK